MAAKVDNPVQDRNITHCGMPEYYQNGDTIDTIY